MTNNDDIKFTVDSEGTHLVSRPPANFDDITFESRGIEKIADQVRELAEEFYGDLIDTSYPTGADDEEVEMHRENQVDLLIKMICISLLGSDKVDL